MALSLAERQVPEGNTWRYKTTLQDESVVPLPLPVASIDSITLTLYDVATGTKINGRDAQDVLNTNEVTIDATSGELIWTALPADMPIVDATTEPGEYEEHIALFEVVYSTDKGLNHEVPISVRQLENVS